MKTIMNKETGEIYEIPDTNELDLVEQHKNEIANLVTDEVLDMYYKKQALDDQIKNFECKVLNAMKEHGIKSIDNEYFNLNFIPEHTTKRVDTDKLKSAGIYDEFTKESLTKESLRVKIK